MTFVLGTDAVVEPSTGLHFPILWIVCLIACALFGLASAYLVFLRRNTYDDRAAWNYAVAAVITGLLSLVAAIVLLNDIFAALGELGGAAIAVVVAGALIAYGNSHSHRGRRYW